MFAENGCLISRERDEIRTYYEMFTGLVLNISWFSSTDEGCASHLYLHRSQVVARPGRTQGKESVLFPVSMRQVVGTFRRHPLPIIKLVWSSCMANGEV